MQPARPSSARNIYKIMSEMICLKEGVGRVTAVTRFTGRRAHETESAVRTSHNLTPRQEQILQLLAKGFYYKEIGAELGISPFTVRAHLHTVYRKLEVKSRARAVVKFNEYLRQS